MFAIALGPALLSLAVFIITVVLTRYVSLGSILAAILFPLFLRLFRAPLLLIGLSLPIVLLILLRHAGNIRRLVAGTERKFGRQTEPSE
jgi:glycerol-3-phosphate acyltransferase PlsY